MSAERDEGEGAGARLFVATLGIGQICSYGTLYYSFPLIAEQIERETGWSRMSLYGAATVGLLFAAAAAYPLGRAIDRGHGRMIMAGGSMLAGLLFLAWTQVNDLLGLYVIVALLGALQAATLYEAAFAVIVRRFGAARSRGGITTLTLWGGFASTVFIPLIQMAIGMWGWRGALVMLGLTNLIICAGIYAAVIRPVWDASRHAERTQASGQATTLRQTMKAPVFWLLTLTFTSHAALFSAFTFHFYPLLVERNFAPAAITLALMLIGPAQVVGRIAVTVVARGVSIRAIGTIAVLGFPLAFVLFLLAPAGVAAIVLVTLLYSTANGILTIVRGAAVPEMLTRQNYGAVMGAMSVPSTLARAAAPLAAAALWSVSQSYDQVVMALLALSVLLAGAFWLAAWLSKRHAVT